VKQPVWHCPRHARTWSIMRRHRCYHPGGRGCGFCGGCGWKCGCGCGHRRCWQVRCVVFALMTTTRPQTIMEHLSQSPIWVWNVGNTSFSNAGPISRPSSPSSPSKSLHLVAWAY